MDSGVETQTCAALRQEIERSLRRAFDPADVLPRLARLARLAPASSDDGVFAHRQLAELLVERHPWRAAIYARRVLAYRDDDDRAWAVLAFCQTLLGNFRCAATAYRQAIASAPANPWYAHNLGHLLDVALGAPARALPWLRSAYGKKGDNSEIVASYVHALARAGQTSEARDVLERALARFDSSELEALMRWLDQGGPARTEAGARKSPGGKSPAGRPGRGAAAGPGDSSSRKPRKRAAVPPPRRREAPGQRKLARVLERGLSRLPLDSRQRERALALAADVLADAARVSTRSSPSRGARGPHVGRSSAGAPDPRRDERAIARAEAAAIAELLASAVLNRKRGGKVAGPSKRAAVASPVEQRASATLPDDVAGLAAAVAYAIVYVDHVPLSQAEVAAPFRVAVGHLRGRFAELRANLDIIPGDARYATRGC